MARVRKAALASGVRQLTIFERLEGLAQRAESLDPRRPANALFGIVTALLVLGLLLQASHAATTLPLADFRGNLLTQLGYRGIGLLVLVVAARVGPSGLRPMVPALTVVSAALLCLVFVDGIGERINGSARWIRVGGITFQPSELARLVLALWVADRCVRLGGLVTDMRRGVVPMLLTAVCFFTLVLVETDLGGAMLLILCLLMTMWVGGARPTHVFGSLGTIGGLAVVLAALTIPYIRGRIAMFLGPVMSEQVEGGQAAMASSGFFGVGLTHGEARVAGVPYMESDFVFALVGEELGLFGMLLVLGLFAAFLWNAARLVLAIPDRYDALASFGLLLSVALQGMLHLQVVSGLAPPKGMTLPFLSHGGTALVVSCLSVGLALGAARRSERERARG